MSLNNLGLAYRANKIVLGTDLVINQMSKLTLVLIANNANKNTVRKVLNKTKTYNVLVNDSYSINELSNAIGKHNIQVIGITDSGFKNLLKKKGS
ncbi:MAG: hypothetical protein WC907_03995 [Acholeplasmataceae bacterium]